MTVTLVPVHHWSARTLWDGNSNLWGGWAAERAGFRFFFSGDTAYSQDFPEVGRRLGPFDLAAIAIGHYEPRWFMRNNHINPEEAMRIHRELGARRSLGIHWGTFERLTRGLPSARGHLLEPDEAVRRSYRLKAVAGNSKRFGCPGTPLLFGA